MKKELENIKNLKLSNENANKLTKECLHTAIITLMSKKKFEDIKITELVKKAGVSRTAFYRNYNSKEEIILEICDNFIKIMKNFVNSDKYKNDYYKFFYDLFCEIRNEKKKFKILLQAKLLNSAILKLDDFMFKIVNPESKKDYYKLLVINTAIFTVIEYWFNSGMEEDEEFMAKLCTDILNNIYY